jgi:hypothetical protein
MDETMKNSKTNGARGAAKARSRGARRGRKTATPDPRTTPAPTAPASVSAGALEAVAGIAETATAEPKSAAKPRRAKTTSRAAKASAKPAIKRSPRVESAATASKGKATPAPAASSANGAAAAFPSPFAAVAVGAEQARAALERASTNSETLRDAVAQSAVVATQGLVELNGKVLDVMRSQGEAALAIWRSALQAGSLSDRIATQSRGVRQAYEATTRWREVAETTARLMSDAAKPLRSALAGAEG